MAPGLAKSQAVPATDKRGARTDNHAAEPHAPVRGLVNAVLLSIPAWLLLGLIIYGLL